MAPEDLPRVLLLSTTQSLNAIDKKILRDCGVAQITTSVSGERAAQFLASNPAFANSLIVIVNQMLEDMSGEQFCRLIRLHPLMLALPILLVLSSQSEHDQLLALGCGATALIARPYSVDTMRAILVQLKNSMNVHVLEKAAHKIDAHEFDAALLSFQALLQSRQRRPEDYFKAGMQCLALQKWNSALAAFQHAMASQVLKGEAELGCAAAWRGKGDSREAQTWLARAAETFISAKKWHNARIVYAKLQIENGSARNPFFIQARKLISSGELDAAAEILSQSVETVPLDEVCSRFAKLCVLATNPDEMVGLLQEALHKRPHKTVETISNALPQEVAAKVSEQKTLEREAQERRREALSRRLNVQAREEENRSAVQEKNDRTEKRQNSDAKPESSAKPFTPIIPKSESGSALPPDFPALISLPGDSVEDDTQLWELPEKKEKTLFPHLRELFHVAMLTWKLSKKML